MTGTLYFWDLRNNRNEHYTPPQLDDVNESLIHIDVNGAGDTICGVSNRGKMLIWSLGDENDMASTMSVCLFFVFSYLFIFESESFSSLFFIISLRSNCVMKMLINATY